MRGGTAAATCGTAACFDASIPCWALGWIEPFSPPLARNSFELRWVPSSLPISSTLK